MSENNLATSEQNIGSQCGNLSYHSPLKPVAPAQVNPENPTAEVKPNPKITIDGKSYDFKMGDTIMQVAERYKLHEEIPRYCYHPSMPIAGTCRMCTVEIEKAPKLMTSCSTPAADGMVVHLNSEKVRKSRTGVMEFLLTNHPLDCPVCDKAGECELQNYNYEYGPSTSRFVEDKRVFEEATTKLLSDKVTLNMNRCVHCERCVRFTEDVTKTNDLLMVNRGYKKELITPDDKGLTSDYQGCLTDFCPVGALTFNDFRFQKRVWFLEKKSSICDGCSKGCNIEVHSDKDVVYRLLPLYNEHINKHWMCDEGRVSYHHPMNLGRIFSPMLAFQGGIHASSFETIIEATTTKIKNAKEVTILIGTDSTLEEAQSLMEKMPKVFNRTFIFKAFNGTNGIKSSSEDEKLDHLLRMKDKTANTRGMEKLGLKIISESEKIESDLVICFSQGRSKFNFTPYLTTGKTEFILWGVWMNDQIEHLIPEKIKAIIPGLATVEKSGRYINTQGITQRFQKAITHKGEALDVDSVITKFEQHNHQH